MRRIVPVLAVLVLLVFSNMSFAQLGNDMACKNGKCKPAAKSQVMPGCTDGSCTSTRTVTRSSSVHTSQARRGLFNGRFQGNGRLFGRRSGGCCR